MKKCTSVFLFSLSLLSTAAASFFYGQPCTDRNTAYLYSTTWIMPENETNCVDITGSGNPNEINYTEFFQLVKQADTLYADHMNLTKFPVLLIHSLIRLETIDLSGNEIRRVPYRMYKVSPHVDKLLLADNAIFVPRRRGLFKSVSIKMLMLSRNGLKHIHPVTFSKMPNLKILYLDGNIIKHIKPQMFLPVTKLQYLHLGQNAISEFPPKRLMPKRLRFYIIKDQKNVFKNQEEVIEDQEKVIK